MIPVKPEPIASHDAHHPHHQPPAHSPHPSDHHPSDHHPHHHPHQPHPTPQPTPHVTPPPLAGRPANVDALIATVQQQFPNAAIRITGRGRTVQRQAELMMERRLQNRTQFLRVYRPAPHITEMDQWVAAHPHATRQETTAAFVDIINRARARGAVVSNHLSDRARDISIPHGGATTQQQVRHRLQELGGHVIDEHDAVGGAHWHVDY